MSYGRPKITHLKTLPSNVMFRTNLRLPFQRNFFFKKEFFFKGWAGTGISSVDTKLDKADRICNEIERLAQEGYSTLVFSRLEKVRKLLSDAMSEIHAAGLSSSHAEKVRSLFGKKFIDYQEITERAFNICCERNLRSAKEDRESCIRQLKNSIEFFYDSSGQPKYNLDFHELIDEYRKPKDLEDAKFLFELEMVKCEYQHDFSRVLKAFNILMIEYYRTRMQEGDEERYREEAGAYCQRFMQVIDLAIISSFIWDLQKLKGQYLDHTLRLNKLWREIQIHTKSFSIQELAAFETVRNKEELATILQKKNELMNFLKQNRDC
jgi:hypothetical protein